MIDLKTRNRKEGPESELITSFLENNNLFKNSKFHYIFIEEAYAELGVPDILIVAWSKKQKLEWNPKRNNLTRDNIKILHHIAKQQSKGITLESIIRDLGFSKKIVNHTIVKLEKADLIRSRGTKFFIYKLKQNFFLRKIITIEAKINKTKEALLQASLNQNFSSQSYVLFPKPRNVKSEIFNNIGVIAHNKKVSRIEKEACEIDLPGSYFSWIINENIGRKVYG